MNDYLKSLNNNSERQLMSLHISAIIITLNEERNIERCLNSLKGVADEIIVVDSFSTDRTKEICLSHHIKFIENNWPGYAAQKNFAQQQASNDFILSLDADEALSEKLADSIRKIKSQAIFHVYSFKRLTNYCGKWIRHGAWYPDIKLRLYDKRKCNWEGIIHERLQYPPSEKVVMLEGDCLHYSFYTIAEHEMQVNKFTDLMAKEAFEKGRRTNQLQILLKPRFKFIRDYIFRLGFLDGYYGFVISRISAHATFLKYVKLKELTKRRYS